MIRARKINSKLNKRKLIRKLKSRTNEEEDENRLEMEENIPTAPNPAVSDNPAELDIL